LTEVARWFVAVPRTGELRAAAALSSIDKLSVANVVLELFILLVLVLQTAFIGQYVSNFCVRFAVTA